MATKKQAPLKITPPFGYRDVVALKRTDRVRLPAPGATPDFCRSTNALALSLGEFPVAARDYPLVFASGGTGKPYAPVIVLGLADRQNLFVDAAGAWDAATYVPAFVRRCQQAEAKMALGADWGRRKRVRLRARSQTVDTCLRAPPSGWQQDECVTRTWESAPAPAQASPRLEPPVYAVRNA